MKSVRQEFVLVKEAAELLGVCSNTIRSWGASGKLVEYRLPINDSRMFKQKDIELIIKRMKSPSRPR